MLEPISSVPKSDMSSDSQILQPSSESINDNDKNQIIVTKALSSESSPEKIVKSIEFVDNSPRVGGGQGSPLSKQQQQQQLQPNLKSNLKSDSKDKPKGDSDENDIIDNDIDLEFQIQTKQSSQSKGDQTTDKSDSADSTSKKQTTKNKTSKTLTIQSKTSTLSNLNAALSPRSPTVLSNMNIQSKQSSPSAAFGLATLAGYANANGNNGTVGNLGNLNTNPNGAPGPGPGGQTQLQQAQQNLSQTQLQQSQQLYRSQTTGLGPGGGGFDTKSSMPLRGRRAYAGTMASAEAQMQTHEANDYNQQSSNMFLEQSSGWLRIRLTFHWFFFIITLGICVGITNVLFHKLHANIERVWEEQIVYKGNSNSTNGSDQGTNISLHIYRAVGVIFSSIITTYLVTFYFPECSGGGHIPVKACILLGVAVPLRVGIARFFISSFYLGFGNPLGPETPALHICAAVSCALYKGWSGFWSRRGSNGGGDIFPPEHVSIMALVGCTCGLSAVFNTPIGGILYALEEYRSIMSGESILTVLIVLASLSSNVIDRIAYQIIDVGDVVLFKAKLPKASDNLEGWMALSFPFGIVCGLFGVMAMRLIIWLRFKMQRGTVERTRPPIWRPALISGVITTTLASALFIVTEQELIGVPLSVWGDGRSSLAKLMKLPFSCPQGRIIEDITFTNPASDSNPNSCNDYQYEIYHFLISSILFTLAKLLAVAAAVGANGPGGLYRSTLVLGGGFGCVAGSLLRLLWGESDSESGGGGVPKGSTDDIFRLFMPLGMAGVFSALIRLPLTAVVIVFEMTGQFTSTPVLAIPMLCTSVVAYFVASEMEPWGLQVLDFVASEMEPWGLYEQIVQQDFSKELQQINSDSEEGSSDDNSKGRQSAIIQSSRGSLLSMSGVGGAGVGGPGGDLNTDQNNLDRRTSFLLDTLGGSTGQGSNKYGVLSGKQVNLQSRISSIQGPGFAKNNKFNPLIQRQDTGGPLSRTTISASNSMQTPGPGQEANHLVTNSGFYHGHLRLTSRSPNSADSEQQNLSGGLAGSESGSGSAFGILQKRSSGIFGLGQQNLQQQQWPQGLQQANQRSISRGSDADKRSISNNSNPACSILKKNNNLNVNSTNQDQKLQQQSKPRDPRETWQASPMETAELRQLLVNQSAQSQNISDVTAQNVLTDNETVEINAGALDGPGGSSGAIGSGPGANIIGNTSCNSINPSQNSVIQQSQSGSVSGSNTTTTTSAMMAAGLSKDPNDLLNNLKLNTESRELQIDHYDAAVAQYLNTGDLSDVTNLNIAALEQSQSQSQFEVLNQNQNINQFNQQQQLTNVSSRGLGGLATSMRLGHQSQNSVELSPDSIYLRAFGGGGGGGGASSTHTSGGGGGAAPDSLSMTASMLLGITNRAAKQEKKFGKAYN